MRLSNASGIVERAVTTPQGWPVRWRLAAVSAALTLVILLGFALVVGRLTANKLEGDFRDDLRGNAGELAFATDVTRVGTQIVIRRPNLGGTAGRRSRRPTRPTSAPPIPMRSRPSGSTR
jgi:hypothetical protein